MGARAAFAPAEAVAADDVEDHVDDRHDDLQRPASVPRAVIQARARGERRTVTMAEMMVMITAAIAEMTALMPLPIAETMDPFNSRQTCQHQTWSEQCRKWTGAGNSPL